MDEKPKFEEICERYAQEMERRLEERGITEEEFLEECENEDSRKLKPKTKKLE